MQKIKVNYPIPAAQEAKWNELADNDKRAGLPATNKVVKEMKVHVTSEILVTLQLVNARKRYIDAVWMDGDTEINREIVDNIAPGQEIYCEYDDVEYIVTFREE